MSNISNNKPNTINLNMGTDGGTVGFDHAVSSGVSVGADVGSAHGQATVGAHATAHIFPDKAFSPFASLGLNAGFGGGDPFRPNVSLKGGADYNFNNTFSIGAYVGVDRALGGGGSPWGASAGITAGIHF